MAAVYNRPRPGGKALNPVARLAPELEVLRRRWLDRVAPVPLEDRLELQVVEADE
jgi:hypothetical protein